MDKIIVIFKTVGVLFIVFCILHSVLAEDDERIVEYKMKDLDEFEGEDEEEEK